MMIINLCPILWWNYMNRSCDVLFIYPIWPSMAGKGKLQRMLPPLGILSIASYLESNNFKVSILDLHTEKLSPQEFRNYLKNLNPTFIGISVLSSHEKVVFHLLNIIKEILPETKIMLGGVHAELYPNDFLINKMADAVCIGDGEETMLEFVQGKDLSKIPGLCFVKNGVVVKNVSRPIEMDLDKYPFPAYHLINMSKYFPAFGTYRRLPAMNLLMTRGCPGKCNFCNSAKTILRGRSPEKMVELIKILRYKYNILQFTFYDDTFTAHRKNLIKFCNLMIEQKIDASWVCYARGDMFDEEIAKLISAAGCHHVLLGIESGSEKLMSEIGKKINKETYHNVVKISHKYNIEVRGAFIIGHLNETKETLKETLDFTIDLDLDFFQPSILTPYPGTELYQYSKKHNLLSHENFELYGQNEVILKMKYLSPSDIKYFLNYSFYRFYLRPKNILKQLRRISSLRHVFDLAQAIYMVIFNKVTKVDENHLNQWLKPIGLSSKNLESNQQLTPTPLTYEVRES